MDRIEAADYHDIVQVSQPAVEPGGDRIAFVRKDPKDDEEYEETVYLAALGGEEPRQFTVAEGQDSQPTWSPSGDRLAFVSTRGADDDRPQLWVMPTDGGEARRVTNVAGGVSGIEWSPDGTRIAFTQQASGEDREEGRDLEVPEEYEPEEPDPRVVDRTVYRSMERYFDGKRSHVYVLDLDAEGEEGLERITDGDVDFPGVTWGDATTLYYAEKVGEDPDHSIEIEVFAYDTESGEATSLFTTTGWGAAIAGTTGGRIAYTYTPEEQASMRQTELKVYDRDADEHVTLTEDLDRTVGYDAAPEWDPDEEEVYFLTPDEGDVVLRRAPGDASADPEVVIAEGALNGFSVGEDAVGFTRSEWDHRGDLFAATRGGAEVNRLSRVNAGYLDGRAVSEPEELRFESEDGVELQGWVLTPPDFDPEETYPLVVEVHGGPHAMWTTSGTMWHEFQTLAARGYVVFWCNPRGSTGYGEDFAMAIERNWGEVTMTDVMAGAERVAEREYVDAGNAFLTGGSFGGYMTSWMVGQTDFFAGAVTQRGVYDFMGFWGSTDFAYRLIEWDYDTDPWAEPGLFWEHSPVAYAPEVTTPTLIVHAEDDFRVPMNNAEFLFRAYRRNGVETRLVRYPDEGHELSRSGNPGHVVDRLERIARWFDGYSEHHDAPIALDRGENEGLSAGEADDDAGGDDADDGDTGG